jgi:hypothetical protein
MACDCDCYITVAISTIRREDKERGDRRQEKERAESNKKVTTSQGEFL